MGEAAKQRVFTGRSASAGFASGEIFALRPRAAARRVAGAPGTEAAALRAALGAALAQVEALAGAAQGEGADMLGFQAAMLGDDALAEAAFARIGAGEPADSAWMEGMAVEIAGYESSEDEYFRARASDLADIRDRVADHLAGDARAAIPSGRIVASRDLTPSQFLSADWRGGAILLGAGSASSHVAMLARSRGVPMVVGLGDAALALAGDVLVDAGQGTVTQSPTHAAAARFARARGGDAELAAAARTALARPARTADGTRIAMMVNIADPDEVDGLDPATCDGVGLVRTEFLFHGRGGLPGEERQLAAYRKILAWACGRPVTIRTLDAGGDKPIPGLTVEGESNPFLGTRGLRLSLAQPDVFAVQLRALLRAAVHGRLKVMLPMVTHPSELAAARALLEAELARLQGAGIACARPELGIMVEVPAAALAIHLFDADFFSIGSNDLTQYVTAAARDIGAVDALNDIRHPAVMRLITEVAAHGRASGRETSLCGDAAGDPGLAPLLLRAGLRALSCAPPLLGRAKLAVAATHLEKAGA